MEKFEELLQAELDKLPYIKHLYKWRSYMKIAIIEITERSYNYGDDYEMIASKITDWEEVDDENYPKVVEGFRYLSFETGITYTIVKFPKNQEEIIEISIQKAIEKYEKRKAEEEKRKIEAEEKKRKAKKTFKSYI